MIWGDKRSILRQCAGRVLRAVRRGRIVAWTPHWMGFGNILLVAQWAYEAGRVGERHWILATDQLQPWLPVFPHLGELVLTREQVKFTDQRVMPWSEATRAHRGDSPVPRHQSVDVALIETFISEVLLPESGWGDQRGPSEESNHLVINVRRGDYYSDPDIRAQYGFDVAAYLRIAIEGSVAQDGLPSLITVVSDDIAWCRSELAWLERISSVVWATHADPVDDFKTVSLSRRMVITNSTFSYWAAHVSNVMHGDNHAQVWAPRFFDRTRNDGHSWLLDERWSVVEDLPGGWDF